MGNLVVLHLYSFKNQLTYFQCIKTKSKHGDFGPSLERKDWITTGATCGLNLDMFRLLASCTKN